MRQSKAILLLLLLFATQDLAAQLKYYEDSWQGGVVTGGWSPGIAASGSGSFTVNIPVASTIRQAYLIGGRAGNAPATTVNLNGTNFTFNATNEVTSGFTSLYGGASGVHVIDVTSSINPLTTNYTMTCNGQSSVSNKFPEFYLWIAFDNPTLPMMTGVIFLNTITFAASMPWTLAVTNPIQTTSPVGLAAVGGYSSASASDCEEVTVNGTFLGAYSATDFNASTAYGAMGAFQYYNNTLTGYGDDNPNQAINGPDVLSNIQALIPNNTNSFVCDFTHCPGGSAADNHVWAVLLAHSGGTALPTDLFDFGAVPHENGWVDTEWKVGMEDGLETYVVERSRDGADFIEIGRVKPEAEPSYRFRDLAPVPGSSWYRLRLIDQNGRYQLSKQVEVTRDFVGQNKIFFYPNPVASGSPVSFEIEAKGRLKIKVIDGKGQVIRKNEFEPGSYFKIGTEGFSSGIYQVLGTSQGKHWTGTFTVGK